MQHSLFETRRALIKAGLSGAALTALGLPLQSLAKGHSRGIQGYAAPELAVPYWIDGKGNEQAPFTLAANKGKWIYLKCFQHWCPGCHSTGFPGTVKLAKAFPNPDQLAIAAIQTTFEGFSTNDQDALRKNQLRYDLDIPFGHDTGNGAAEHGSIARYPKTMVTYQTGGTPWIIIINPKGDVVFNDFRVDVDKLITYLSEQFV